MPSSRMGPPSLDGRVVPAAAPPGEADLDPPEDDTGPPTVPRSGAPAAGGDAVPEPAPTRSRVEEMVLKNRSWFPGDGGL